LSISEDYSRGALPNKVADHYGNPILEMPLEEEDGSYGATRVKQKSSPYPKAKSPLLLDPVAERTGTYPDCGVVGGFQLSGPLNGKTRVGNSVCMSERSSLEAKSRSRTSFGEHEFLTNPNSSGTLPQTTC
jgi:hypothetical protein